VGGIRISHLSHIEKPITVALTVTRGKKAPFVVQPLTTKDTSGRDWLTELAAADGNADAIEALGVAARTAGAQPAVLTVIRQAYKDAKEAQS
jgi:pyruvate carboxylase